MNTQALELLDSEALAKIQSFSLRVERIVEGTLAGLHSSKRRGSAVKFAEHRQYTPGDDLRRLDWKVFARYDRYYVRHHEDENELRAHLCLDCSASMGYGKPLSKLEYGASLLGSLAYLLARQRDQPGLVAFNDRVVEYLAPRKRSAQIADVLDALSRTAAAQATRIECMIDALEERQVRRGLIVVVSDLLDTDLSILPRLRRFREARVVLFHLLHTDELDFPFRGLMQLEHPENERKLLIEAAVARNAYKEAVVDFIAEAKGVCRDSNVTYRAIQTNDALDAVLLQLLSPNLGTGR